MNILKQAIIDAVYQNQNKPDYINIKKDIINKIAKNKSEPTVIIERKKKFI